MKNNTTSLILFVLFLALVGCKKEYPTPESSSNCSIQYQNHPLNSQYQAIVDRYCQEGFVGLTVLVDDSVTGLWIGSSGYADMENKVKMTPCHLHHTASIYKTYIAVLIMQLVDEGKLALTDKLEAYVNQDILEQLPNGREVTIENLLQHRTGMPDVFETDFIFDFFNSSGESYSIEKLLQYDYGAKAVSEPGTNFFYSDANYALLSLVINHFEGDYGVAIQTRIFQELALQDSYFLFDAKDAPKGLANSYWDRFGNGIIENISDWQINFTSGLKGTDGVVTSAQDLKHFLQAVVHGNLLSPASVLKMTTFVDVPESEKQKHGITGYGYGLMRVNVGGDDWFGHFGNHIGSAALALYNPKRNITIVAFENTGSFFSDKIKPLFYNQLIRDIESIAYSAH